MPAPAMIAYPSTLLIVNLRQSAISAFLPSVRASKQSALKTKNFTESALDSDDAERVCASDTEREPRSMKSAKKVRGENE